ncbi:DUF3179 domain-containing protein [Pseudoprimorskyibacter insulae]|uniref:DUF3179 domain-containing protein n=1 Tax=Pseudoprimorskyibacter insulae TaxID=1695997 RepID=A0A2R8AY50_9RHOB|nr:DUF3179 domain-containing protein [Pseudoprimorskyibacter insulae]SPF80799.1 hypothetical protein PRI8871_02611 [Pseudoprimorskyibacter insulae]
MRLFAILIAMILPYTSSADPSFWRHEWPNTEFSNKSIASWVEILSGGPPKDGIPALTNPRFRTVQEAAEIKPSEPVIVLKITDYPARAYPIRYLIWHEIVNDVVANTPVTVTFCPLCNSVIVFKGVVGGRALTFGVTGKLRNSDMIMYDHQTESWWQQALGVGIVGEMTGQRLEQLPVWTESFAQFSAAHADGLVMQTPQHDRPYGQNPYAKYDSSHRPFLYNGDLPPHGIAPLERVVAIDGRAWPLERLRNLGSIEEAGWRITWTGGQSSALDTAEIAKGRDVGSIRVQGPDGKDVPHDVLFAFAFHAFWPGGVWMLGD